MTDNIENKVTEGADAGTYESNSLVAFCSIPESVLIEDGLLNDDDPDMRLSREGKKLPEVVLEVMSSPPPISEDNPSKNSMNRSMKLLLDKFIRPTEDD